MLTLRFIKDVRGLQLSPDITNEVLCSEPYFTSYCILKLESSHLMTQCVTDQIFCFYVRCIENNFHYLLYKSNLGIN